MPKGVIWAGVSAGSNQAGTIVTGQAITSAPAGWGWALRPWLQATITAATVSSMVREYRSFMVMSLPLLLQPHLFQKQVCLVIETIIFHLLPVGLVEGIPGDVHPLHLLSEPTLDVGADLLTPLGFERPAPLQHQRLHRRIIDPQVNLLYAPLTIPLMYCHINSFQRAYSVGRP